MNHARRYFDAWGVTATVLVSLDLWGVVRLVHFGHGPYVATAVIWLSYLVLGSLCVGVWRAERLALRVSQLLGWALVLVNTLLWVVMESVHLGLWIGGWALIALHAAALLYGLVPRTRAAFGPLATASNA